MRSVDAVVIGLGVGGERVATRLASAGKDVLAVTDGLVGGVCPFWGCVPTKMAIRAGMTLQAGRRVNEIAGRAEVVPDWQPVARRIRDDATDSWDDDVAVRRLVDSGATFVRGTARIVEANRVDVDGTPVETSTIVVATGSTPSVPPVRGLEDVDYWTSRDMVTAESLPASCIVLGGGAIGVEIAQMMSRFGVQMVVVEVADSLLPGQEPVLGERLEQVLTAEGLEIVTGSAAEHVAPHDSGVSVTLADGRQWHAERLLVATGRTSNPSGVGLDALGVDADAPHVEIDEWLRVRDGVYAVGDVTGVGQFTHLSLYQADVAARHILGEPGPPADYRAMPRVTFTDPEIATLGLDEQQARDSLDHVRVGSVDITETSRGNIYGPGGTGVIKLVEDAEAGVLVGASVMAPHGGEVLGALSVAVQAQVPTETLRETIFAYPTFVRGIGTALENLA
jgi:pyruvate/2-oxoglutarate dehydrogenase complex dihydrolipoamide dehydrogenase (E3) component